MTYFSYLSKIGTVYQRLMQRTPLASIGRGPARAYTQPAAKVDLAKKPGVLNAVMAHLMAPCKTVPTSKTERGKSYFRN